MVNKKSLLISGLINIFGKFDRLLRNNFLNNMKSWHGCCLYAYAKFFCFQYCFKKGFNMRKSIINLAVLSAMAMPLASHAAEPAKEEKPSYTVAYNVGLFSQYIFRGLTQTNNHAALQGGVDFTHDSGFYLGSWGSNISWLSDPYPNSGDASPYKSGGSLELDFYGGFRTEIAKSGVGIDIGALQYYYPGKRDSSMIAKANTTELYGALSYSWLQAKISTVVSNSAWGVGKYDAEGSKKATGTYYAELNATLPVGDWIGGDVMKGTTIIAHVGRQDFAKSVNDPYSYTDYKLGAQKAFDSGLNVGAYWTKATTRDSLWTYDGSNIGGSTGTVYIQKTF